MSQVYYEQHENEWGKILQWVVWIPLSLDQNENLLPALNFKAPQDETEKLAFNMHNELH